MHGPAPLRIGEEDAAQLTTEVVSATPGATRYLAGMEPGWNQSLTRLTCLLQTLTDGDVPN